jgi:glucose-1-phosphate cytidylyltransferase
LFNSFYFSDMKCVVLAGGRGSRISEESGSKPKPMIEIGGHPLLWHIMKLYGNHGISDFIICCGYKGYVIKEYFANFFLHSSDVTFDLNTNNFEIHKKNAEPWRVTLVDTGEDSMTGGRLRRVSSYLEGEVCFCFTYGDGLANVDLTALVSSHHAHGRLATVTAVKPPGRFGALSLDGHRVVDFQEKPEGDGAWINGGFFVLSPKVLDYIEGDTTIWEHGPMERLAREDEFQAFFHEGFWQPMDTLRDKTHLEELWQKGQAPWKVW